MNILNKSILFKLTVSNKNPCRQNTIPKLNTSPNIIKVKVFSIILANL